MMQVQLLSGTCLHRRPRASRPLPTGTTGQGKSRKVYCQEPELVSLRPGVVSPFQGHLSVSCCGLWWQLLGLLGSTSAMQYMQLAHLRALKRARWMLPRYMTSFHGVTISMMLPSEAGIGKDAWYYWQLFGCRETTPATSISIIGNFIVVPMCRPACMPCVAHPSLSWRTFALARLPALCRLTQAAAS
jgi:hypothetical protein